MRYELVGEGGGMWMYEWWRMGMRVEIGKGMGGGVMIDGGGEDGDGGDLEGD